jgi:hypothetical protein
MRRISFWICFLIALGSGLLIAWVDSRPGWDDTGITVGAILLVSGGLSLAIPQRAWLWAFLVGVWVPVAEMSLPQNYASIFALIFAFLGAYSGYGARRVISAVLGSDPGKS